MNSRIKKALLFFGIIMLSVNLSTVAQNKEKPTMKKAEVSNSLEDEEKTMKILKERMETASPEEKVKIQKKLDAYYGKKNADNLNKSKEQIQDAYFQYQASEEKLENAKAAIEKAEAELLEMEKQDNLSKDEIEARKQRLNKAKEELIKSQEALKKQMEAIKTKRAEMTKSE